MSIKGLFNKLFHKPKEFMSFKQGLDLTGVPVITMYQGTTKLNFILDTGSAYNVVDPRLLKTLKHRKDEDTVFQSVDINNNTTVAKCCIIPVNFKSIQYQMQFSYKSDYSIFDTLKKETGVSVHGIIGSKFFEEHKYVLDFQDYTAYEKN